MRKMTPERIDSLRMHAAKQTKRIRSATADKEEVLRAKEKVEQLQKCKVVSLLARSLLWLAKI